MLPMSADLLQRALVIIMNVSVLAAAGVAVDAAELRALLRERKLLAWIVGLNLVALPLAAWGGTHVLGLTGPVAAGVLLAVVPPGGGTGLVLTRAARGSMHLAIGMLFFFVLLSSAVTPLLLSVFGFSPDALWSMYLNTIAFQAIPFTAGLLIKRYARAAAPRWEKLLSRTGLVSLVTLVIGLVATKGGLLFEQDPRAVLLMGFCALAGIASGFVVPAAPEIQAAFGLSTGIRNLSLSLLLAGALATDSATLLIVLTYGLLMYVLGFPAAMVYRRRIPGRSRSLIVE